VQALPCLTAACHALSELDLCAAAHSRNQFVAAVQFQRRAAGERLMWFVILLCEFHLLVSSLSCVVVLFVSHLERAEFVTPITSCSKLQAAASVCASGSSVCAVLCWYISVHSRHLLKQCCSMLASPTGSVCLPSATCRARSALPAVGDDIYDFQALVSSAVAGHLSFHQRAGVRKQHQTSYLCRCRRGIVE
jgi:hypothetical protein